jgi:histidinol-phosphate aminotransferase
MSAPRFRPALDAIRAFQPSGRVTPPGELLRLLAANESPYPPPDAVVRAIHEQALGVNRYPDNGCGALLAEISAHLGVPADSVVAGCGSVGATQMLLAAVAEPGVEIVYADPSFEAYRILTRLSGATPVEVPLRDGGHDLPAMAAAITDRTRLIFVCNPNNPTGTVVSDLEVFVEQVPPGCLVVLDEAYIEYARTGDGLALARSRRNVLVLRTFSKAYGLAGLRVGFVAGHPETIAAIRRAYLPFSVNSIAQAAAIAALRSADELMARVSATVAERDRVTAELVARGWPVTPSEANFVWLPLGDRAADFAVRCAAAGVVVRAFPGAGVRITIGAPDENDALLTVAGPVGDPRPHRASGC